jgi:hypothetical protein
MKLVGWLVSWLNVAYYTLFFLKRYQSFTHFGFGYA